MDQKECMILTGGLGGPGRMFNTYRGPVGPEIVYDTYRRSWWTS